MNYRFVIFYDLCRIQAEKPLKEPKLNIWARHSSSDLRRPSQEETTQATTVTTRPTTVAQSSKGATTARSYTIVAKQRPALDDHRESVTELTDFPVTCDDRRLETTDTR